MLIKLTKKPIKSEIVIPNVIHIGLPLSLHFHGFLSYKWYQFYSKASNLSRRRLLGLPRPI